ncbi:hypothetical protein [Sphingosinicella sp. LY1275]|uniref:hypothetical protein n=1 Tax=Sphingosinicella sp. LY1275 TaxID=3095379 RepID=UPI002ADEF7AF|nr:hypothetical protein [Sphingosinicella sp. LY1275]MEA1015585.1 hypothetical protein [Sphingosinicella sp. LY1275]
MATTTLEAGCAHGNSCAPPEHPDDFPNEYASTLTGDCLEPVYREGDCLVFSKTEKPAAGDFVGVWIAPEHVPPGENPRLIKRLGMGVMPGVTFPFKAAPSSDVEPIVYLDMLNPPRRFRVRASHILAMHKVIGAATDNGDGTARIQPNEERQDD